MSTLNYNIISILIVYYCVLKCNRPLTYGVFLIFWKKCLEWNYLVPFSFSTRVDKYLYNVDFHDTYLHVIKEYLTKMVFLKLPKNFF